MKTLSTDENVNTLIVDDINYSATINLDYNEKIVNELLSLYENLKIDNRKEGESTFDSTLPKKIINEPNALKGKFFMTIFFIDKFILPNSITKFNFKFPSMHHKTNDDRRSCSIYRICSFDKS